MRILLRRTTVASCAGESIATCQTVIEMPAPFAGISQEALHNYARMREWIEYAAAWAGLKILGLLPRAWRGLWARALRAAAYLIRTPLRRAAAFNLKLAFPDWNRGAAKKDNSPDGAADRLDGGGIRAVSQIRAGEHRANRGRRRRGEFRVRRGSEAKGVLFLTGHMSAWELAPFAHALYGHPLHFLVRPIKNRRVDELDQSLSVLVGEPAHREKQIGADDLEGARGWRDGGNSFRSQHGLAKKGYSWIFSAFRRRPLPGLARIALRTDAAVVPGFL